MAEVLWSARAREDLIAIWLRLFEVASEKLADDILDRIERRADILSRYPRIGPARPDISATARMLIESRWLILYEIRKDEPTEVRIVRVVDGSIDLRSVDF